MTGMLKKDKQNCRSDVDLLLMVEKGIRGRMYDAVYYQKR